MARKTFISYKYSESRNLRDRIIDALAEDASYYQGETSDSDDMSDETNQSITEVLKDMIFDTSVTIVILSPKMTESHWIYWEIEYSLKAITRGEKTSHTNGIVAVIKKVDGGYSWFKSNNYNCHGSSTVSYDMSKVFNIISNNHFNSNPPQWHCKDCKTYDYLNGSYIAFIEEDVFLEDPQRYIENAYEKSQRAEEKYKLEKTR